nr:DUF1778 domain-containing protein [Azotobacter vinelandii]
MNSALAHAEKTIREHEVMSLKASDAEAFFDALSKPVMFNKKLAAVLESHEQRVTGR